MNRLCAVVLVLVCGCLAQNCSNPLSGGQVPPGFCPYIWADNLRSPRGMITVSNGDVLVVESGAGQVTVLWDVNGDGISDASERARLAGASGLNHGIAVSGGYLYASNPTTVYRWKYTVGDRTDRGAAQVVVKNVPCCHHSTRSLAADQNGLLLVQSGSEANVAKDDSHSRIHRFNVSGEIPAGGIDWNTGFVYAHGMRNEVGIRFDSQWRLWGVENGVDDLARSDMGGDIHTDNPCEEMNLFERIGGFYGYPYCWSSFKLQTHPWGTQFAQPDTMNDGTHNDAWCQNPQNVVKPAWCFPAHMAPLDLIFWDLPSFPPPYNSGVFATMHGSWDRQPPAGYQVRHVVFTNGLPSGDSVFLAAKGTQAHSSAWPHRPVSVAISKCHGFTKSDCLIITSDATNVILAVAYSG